MKPLIIKRAKSKSWRESQPKERRDDGERTKESWTEWIGESSWNVRIEDNVRHKVLNEVNLNEE